MTTPAKWRTRLLCLAIGLTIGLALFHVGAMPAPDSIHAPTDADLSIQRALGPSLVGIRTRWRARP